MISVRQPFAGIAVVFFAVFSFTSGCAKRNEPEAPFVAKVGESRITAADLERELKQIGLTVTPGQREAALQNLIRTEVLYVRAQETGFDKDAETKARVKKLVASAYEEKLRGPEKTLANSPSELEEYYATHAGDFLAPERIKVAAILLRVPRKAADEKRAEVTANVENILAEAKKLPGNVANFGDLARQFSEDQASRYLGGELGWMSRKEAEARWDAGMAEAVFQMKMPGEIRGPMPTQEGIVIFKLVSREETKAKPLSEVRELVAYRVRQEKEAAEQKAFEEKLRAGLKIEIDRAQVETVKVSATNAQGAPPALPGK